MLTDSCLDFLDVVKQAEIKSLAIGCWLLAISYIADSRLANTLSGGDLYDIQGRAPFKEEFVTCGGISLESVNPTTLESRHVPALYFAGELLDIDGVTGGFNFQAAWTTAYTAAQAIIKI